MKVLGIVAEYNPFHNGHMYHIEQSKLETGCEAVVCVMSGNFIQRGEPALVNKFARAEMALQSGVDLVIELPVPFAIASAELFGFGAVKILDSIGVVDYISFGSEHGIVSELQKVSDILSNEPEEYKEELKKQLSLGFSFPVCRQKALKKFLEVVDPDSNPSGLAALLETSNNILAIEYLKALNKLKSNISPHTIKRISNQYNSPELTGTISSATSIRNIIQESYIYGQQSLEKATQALPKETQEIIEREISLGKGPNSLASYENIIFGFLRQMTIEEISEIPDVTEGLEHRIKKAGGDSGSLEELISKISTRRYTRTRIQRILMSLLTGIRKNDMDLFMKYGGPQYCRVLGFNPTGRELLSKMKKASMLPVITKASNFKTSCNRLLTRMLDIEAQSTDLYVLAYKNPAFKKAGQEYTSNIIF